MVTDLLVRINATAAGYDAAMAKAQLSTYKFDTALRSANLAVTQLEAEMAAAGPAAAAQAAKMAEAQTAATIAMTRKVGTAFGVMGLAGAAGFGLLAKAAADFDEKMATLGSLIPHTAKQMDGLRTAAMNAGKDIAVSGTAAADAEIELAKAGISAADIMGGALRGALVLAAAGQTDVATATTVAASAMTQFGLHGKDVGHIADLLAAGADKSLGSVTDLGYALSQAGTTAHQAGVSIEETTGVLAEFAAAGLIGERGGTTFKQMLLQLQAPTDKAKELMNKFNLSLYDASGNMKSMPAIAGNLNKAFSDLEPKVRNAALATIFGSRAVQGANILMQAGTKTTAEWIAKVDDQGFAADQARDKLDSLNGDLDKFKTAITDAAIQTGEATQGPLRDLVQMLTSLVKGFNGLPDPVKSSTVALLAITTAVGGVGFVMSRMIITFAAAKTAMNEMGMATGGLSKKMVGMRAGAGVAGAALFALNTQVDDSHQALKGLLNIAGGAAMGAVFGPWGAVLGGAAGLMATFAGNTDDASASLDGLTHSLKGATGQATKFTEKWLIKDWFNKDQLGNIATLNMSLGQVSKAMLSTGPAADKMIAHLEAMREKLRQTYLANRGFTDSQSAQFDAINRLLPVLEDERGAIDKDRAATGELAQAQAEAKGTTNASAAALEHHNKILNATAGELANAKHRTDEFTSGLGKVPGSANAAERAVAGMASGMSHSLAGIRDEQVRIQLSAQAQKVQAQLGSFGFAGGGRVTGHGSSTSDSVPAMLSAGEHVWTAAEVARAGGHDAVMSLRELAMLGGLSGFAGGGPAVIPSVSSKGFPQAVGRVNSMFEHAAAALGVALSKKLSDALTQLTLGGFGGASGPAMDVVRRVTAGIYPSWAVGEEWRALAQLVMSESSGVPTAQNPTSSAYGLFQFLDSTWASVGGHKTSNPALQTIYGDRYIASRYGDPMAAWAFHLANNWYGGGLSGGLFTQPTLIGVGERGPERVDVTPVGGYAKGGAVSSALDAFNISPKQSADRIKSEIHALIQALRDALGKKSPILDRLRDMSKRLVDAAKAQDRATDHLDALREKMDAYAKSVTDTFRHDPFGGGAENLLTQLRADRNDARSMHQALRKARGKGLSGGLFKALAASGDLETAQQLAHMTPAEIHKYEIAYAQRNKATSTLGQYAGQQVFGKEIHGVRKELHHLNKQIHHLEHAINQIGPNVQHGAHKGTREGTRTGMREQGRRTAVGIR